MTLDHDEAVALGREVVLTGDLKRLRIELGLTANAMAEMLYTAWPTYKAWETRPVNLRSRTAARVGLFYHNAQTQLKTLSEDGVNIRDMVPFHVAATLLGIPQEQLFYRYRAGEFEGADMGILGLWIHQADLDELRR
jgi:DNA-binding XRE family transcriptional regulator